MQANGCAARHLTTVGTRRWPTATLLTTSIVLEQKLYAKMLKTTPFGSPCTAYVLHVKSATRPCGKRAARVFEPPEPDSRAGDDAARAASPEPVASPQPAFCDIACARHTSTRFCTLEVDAASAAPATRLACACRKTVRGGCQRDERGDGAGERALGARGLLCARTAPPAAQGAGRRRARLRVRGALVPCSALCALALTWSRARAGTSMDTRHASMKRAREADEAAAAQPPEDAAALPAASPPSDSEDAAPARPRKAATVACPFLDTVNRAVLDFDFEKCCSVTLSPLHCYACLVCGKYFQGRGPATMAYTHALEAGHHVFMKLADGRVYCLPDGYEVLDRSLDDIRHVLDPRFNADALTALDTSRTWSSALDGTEYLPGVVGLNNIKATDYVNVVLQALMRVKPLRDLMLRRCHAAGLPARDSPVLQRFGELTRKVWNPRNFKGQVRCNWAGCWGWQRVLVVWYLAASRAGLVRRV